MPKHVKMAPAQVDTRVPFVGRDAELELLLAFFERGGALTMLGPGGVGKSRLAYEAARRYAERSGRAVIFAALAGVVPDAAIGTVASAAGAHAPVSGNLADALRAQLAARHAVLVVDNCEHAPDEIAALIETLRKEPSIAVLATSQRRLDYADEKVAKIEPFTVDDGVRFFAARARIDAPGTQTLAEIATIVRRLDGLPVALDLAAARLASLTLRELAEELATLRPYDLRSTRGLEPRHRTIGNVIAWSHSRLSDLAKHAFALCSAFARTFTVRDAAAMLEMPEPQAALALDELGDRSLIASADGGYMMLSPIRAVAARMLAQMPNRRGTELRFAEHMSVLAAELRARIESADGTDTMEELQGRYGDFCAALNWALKRPWQRLGVAIDVATTLAALWADGGRTEEGLRWTARFDAIAPRLSPDLRGRLHYLSLRVAYAACDYERMLAIGPSAISAFTIAGDRLGLARAYNGMAVAALYTGRLDQAETCVRTAIAFYRAIGHERGVASALANEGNIALEGRRDAVAAREAYVKSIEILSRTGSDALSGVSYGNLAEAEFHLGELDAAERAALRAIERFRRAHSIAMAAWQEQLLASIETARGRLARARAHLRTALELLSASPHPLYLAQTAEAASRLLVRDARHEDAALAFEAARLLRRKRSLPATGPAAPLLRDAAASLEAALGTGGIRTAAARVAAWDMERLPERLALLLTASTMVGAERGEELL
jgi:predicted ATPase